jgi:hypothetical protein
VTVHFDEAKGRHIINFELHHNGKRIRKTKMLPAVFDHEMAVRWEQKMLRAYDPPCTDLRQRL